MFKALSLIAVSGLLFIGKATAQDTGYLTNNYLSDFSDDADFDRQIDTIIVKVHTPTALDNVDLSKNDLIAVALDLLASDLQEFENTDDDDLEDDVYVGQCDDDNNCCDDDDGDCQDGQCCDSDDCADGQCSDDYDDENKDEENDEDKFDFANEDSDLYDDSNDRFLA